MADENPLVFPKQADKARIERYQHFDRLYLGDHFDAFSIKVEDQFTKRYKKLRYIVANFAGLQSRVMADMLFGENPSFDYQDKANQDWSDRFFEENQLLSQLYESALGNSRRGDSVIKLRVGQRNPNIEDSDATVIAEEVTPAIYFPDLDVKTARNQSKEDVIATTFDQNGKTYLHKEIHFPGEIYNEVWLYDKQRGMVVNQENPEDFGFESRVETGVERSLVFHIPNVRSGFGFWGDSDYQDLESLFFALNNRITKVDNILDKHSDPMLAVPTGFLDDKGKVRREHMGIYEVDNENPGFNKPEYIIWDANLEAAFKEVDKLVELLFMFSEISPSTMGMDKDGGQAESGRALKFKLLATIRKKKRKQAYYDQAIKDLVETAQELSVFHKVSVGDATIKQAERPKILWPDGVINDQVEDTEVAGLRIDQGTMSRADAISRLDNVSPEDAKKKVAEIDKDDKPSPPVIENNLGDPNQKNQPPTPGKPPQPGNQPPKKVDQPAKALQG